MSDELNLLPCPFCGTKAAAGTLPDNGVHFAGCSDEECIGRGVAYDFVDVPHAVAAWNRRAAPVAQLDADLPPLPRVITEETAKQYMEESLWAFIECAGNYPSIKPDARIWPHVTACMPPAELPPVAPKGPFADYSAEEIEAYAREYVAPYVERIRHLERELEERVDSSNTTGGCGRCPRDTPYGPATCGKCLEAEECAKQPAQSIDTPEFREFMDSYDDKASYGSLKHARAGLVAFIDGRTAGTASEAARECTQPMLEAAMKAAVAAKLFPKFGDENAYLGYWSGMKSSINAALAAAPSTQEGAKCSGQS